MKILPFTAPDRLLAGRGDNHRQASPGMLSVLYHSPNEALPVPGPGLSVIALAVMPEGGVLKREAE